MHTKKFDIYIDGGSRGNPGPGACAAAVFDEKGRLVEEAGKYLGHCTNNFAEYNGLILALSAACRLGAGQIKVFSDSELLVKQFNGEYKIKDPVLKELMCGIKKAAADFASVKLSHVPRSGNEHADRLVNNILDSAANGELKAENPVKGLGKSSDQPELF